jgi:hypothetical protein
MQLMNRVGEINAFDKPVTRNGGEDGQLPAVHLGMEVLPTQQAPLTILALSRHFRILMHSDMDSWEKRKTRGAEKLDLCTER